MDSTEIRHSFCAHVVLYAKGWYGETNNIIDDLRKLLSEYSMLEPQFLPDNDIREFIVETFVATVRPHLQTRILTEAFGWSWHPENLRRSSEETLIGNISVCEGEWAHRDLIFQKFARKGTW